MLSEASEEKSLWAGLLRPSLWGTSRARIARPATCEVGSRGLPAGSLR